MVKAHINPIFRFKKSLLIKCMVDGIVEKGLTLLSKGLNLAQMKTQATNSCLKTTVFRTGPDREVGP